MQRDLQALCQQLSRREASSSATALKQQSQQLARCEAELLQSVEKLIDERAELLRRIAQEQRLSLDELRLALGEWCQCHDHPQLKDWLLEQDAPAAGLWSSASSERPSLIAELQRTHAQRELAELNAQHCRRLLNGIVPQPLDGTSQSATRLGTTTRRTTTEILDSLQIVNQELQRAEEHDRLREELQELRAQLRQSPMDHSASPFRAAVDRHILGLLGGNPPATLARVAAFRATDPNSARESVRRYDTMDGTVVEQPADWAEYHVPAAVVRAAIRLAIAESLAQRHEPIPLILDETLDQLEPPLQRAAIAYLSVVAQGKQQIIVLTADEHVAGLIQQQQGAVHYLNRPQSVVLPHDINRQLAAYANDAEADKWTHPGSGVERPRPTTRSEYYLNDRSLIERLPSIDATSAVRCRALGIDRVGDLLDADPEWLAEKMDLSTVSQATIRVWQAEARLLCSVRKLRPFDASVLVGAGIRSPRQLSEMHPSQLFDHVERFLATDRGRRILRSGSSFELSRITAWIASANTGSNRYQRSSLIDDERPVSADDEAQPYSSGAAHRSSTATPNHRRGRGTRSSGRTATRPARPAGSQRSKSSSAQDSRQETVRLADVHESEPVPRMKFFLELSSPVVDAPSIGPRMSGRLERLGIVSVDQLLAADAERIADKLNLRRVSAAAVQAWQHQARLVCRIPNLRGHDAQLLVACGLVLPEEVAHMEANTLLSRVLEVARSDEGQRILRGGQEPDFNEVSNWITWASHCRMLAA